MPPIVIDGEENAKAVYECPADNMFGLERIVIFKYEVVIVFDKMTCDRKSRYGGSLADATNENIHVYVTMDNADGVYNLTNKIEVRDGKYIVTKQCYEARKYDPDKDVTVDYISVNGKSIFIDDGDFYLIGETKHGQESSLNYTQRYDSKAGKWGKVENYVVPVMSTVPNGSED